MQFERVTHLDVSVRTCFAPFGVVADCAEEETDNNSSSLRTGLVLLIMAIPRTAVASSRTQAILRLWSISEAMSTPSGLGRQDCAMDQGNSQESAAENRDSISKSAVALRDSAC